MGAWTFGRTAGGTAVLVAVALATWAAMSASAQPRPEPSPSEPGMLPPLPTARVRITPAELPAVTNDEDAYPKLILPGEEPEPDPDVEQAQFTRPGRPTPGPSPTPGGSPAPRPVADPPSPVVRIQVRVPSDSSPGDDLKYIITVQNTSQADAHQVTVRNPIPEGVEKVVKADPQYDNPQQKEKQLVWSFGTLRPGDRKTIELVMTPKPGVKEVKNLAYVRFEHGEQVTTRINQPTVKVAKTAPKQTVHGETFTVRVVVENTGRVPAQKVRVIEDVERSAEFEAITAGASRTRPEGNQWHWEVGTLMPGERKVIEYRVTPQLAAEARTLTNVQYDKGELKTAEARTDVLKPGLGVKLTGSTGLVGASETARYEITVRNTGTLPSTNVRVTGTIPADCKPTMKTEGGQVTRDSIVWTIPRLEPGAAQSFRFGLKAGTSGQRTVAASATDARKVQSADELRVVFQGVAALVWETDLEPAERAVGQQGTFTIVVKNNGGAEARNVGVEVDLPDEVGLKRATPEARQTGGKLVFGPATISPRGEATYTVIYEARRAAHARFRARMTADVLTKGPLETEKVVSITGGSK
ncbi:MAG: hypothetical protein JWO38_1207 [Gemmataceae bacterium]|nr:hypothetical protein [Gemmataceae bacterium]